MSLEYDLLEGPSEVPVKNSVYDGVQTAVAVSDPEEQIEECVRYRAVLSAESLETVREEEWEPTKDKNPHHHSQNKREALLPHLSHFVFGQRHLPAAERHRGGQEAVVGEVVRRRP